MAMGSSRLSRDAVKALLQDRVGSAGPSSASVRTCSLFSLGDRPHVVCLSYSSDVLAARQAAPRAPVMFRSSVVFACSTARTGLLRHLHGPSLLCKPTSRYPGLGSGREPPP